MSMFDLFSFTRGKKTCLGRRKSTENNRNDFKNLQVAGLYGISQLLLKPRRTTDHSELQSPTYRVVIKKK